MHQQQGYSISHKNAVAVVVDIAAGVTFAVAVVIITIW